MFLGTTYALFFLCLGFFQQLNARTLFPHGPGGSFQRAKSHLAMKFRPHARREHEHEKRYIRHPDGSYSGLAEASAAIQSLLASQAAGNGQGQPGRGGLPEIQPPDPSSTVATSSASSLPPSTTSLPLSISSSFSSSTLVSSSSTSTLTSVLPWSASTTTHDRPSTTTDSMYSPAMSRLDSFSSPMTAAILQTPGTASSAVSMLATASRAPNSASSSTASISSRMGEAPFRNITEDDLFFPGQPAPGQETLGATTGASCSGTSSWGIKTNYVTATITVRELFPIAAFNSSAAPCPTWVTPSNDLPPCVVVTPTPSGPAGNVVFLAPTIESTLLVTKKQPVMGNAAPDAAVGQLFGGAAPAEPTPPAIPPLFAPEPAPPTLPSATPNVPVDPQPVPAQALPDAGHVAPPVPNVASNDAAKGNPQNVGPSVPNVAPNDAGKDNSHNVGQSVPSTAPNDAGKGAPENVVASVPIAAPNDAGKGAPQSVGPAVPDAAQKDAGQAAVPGPNAASPNAAMGVAPNENFQPVLPGANATVRPIAVPVPIYQVPSNTNAAIDLNPQIVAHNGEPVGIRLAPQALPNTAQLSGPNVAQGLAAPVVAIAGQNIEVHDTNIVVAGNVIQRPSGAATTTFNAGTEKFILTSSQVIQPDQHANLPPIITPAPLIYHNQPADHSLASPTDLASGLLVAPTSTPPLTPIVLDDHTIYINPDIAIVDSDTYSFSPEKAPTTFGGVVVGPNGVQVGTASIPVPTRPPEYSVVTHAGVTLSLAPADAAVGDIHVHNIQSGMNPLTTTVNGQMVEIGSAGVVVAGQTLSLPATSSTAALNGLTFTLAASQVIVQGKTIPAGSPITTAIDGRTVEVSPSGVTVHGSTINLPISNTLSISLGATQAILNGTSYPIGAGASEQTLVVDGKTVHIGPEGLVVPAQTDSTGNTLASEITLAPKATPTAIGDDISADASQAVIQGTTYRIGTGAVETTISANNSRQLVLGPSGIAAVTTPSLIGTAVGTGAIIPASSTVRAPVSSILGAQRSTGAPTMPPMSALLAALSLLALWTY